MLYEAYNDLPDNVKVLLKQNKIPSEAFDAFQEALTKEEKAKLGLTSVNSFVELWKKVTATASSPAKKEDFLLKYIDIVANGKKPTAKQKEMWFKNDTSFKDQVKEHVATIKIKKLSGEKSKTEEKIKEVIDKSKEGIQKKAEEKPTNWSNPVSITSRYYIKTMEQALKVLGDAFVSHSKPKYEQQLSGEIKKVEGEFRNTHKSNDGIRKLSNTPEVVIVDGVKYTAYKLQIGKGRQDHGSEGITDAAINEFIARRKDADYQSKKNPTTLNRLYDQWKLKAAERLGSVGVKDIRLASADFKKYVNSAMQGDRNRPLYSRYNNDYYVSEAVYKQLKGRI